MFWGVALDVGMQYTQVVQRSFHISMATLEPGDGGGGGDGDGEGEVSVMIQHDSSDFALCTLQPHIRPQQALDLDFHCGEHVTFYLHGNKVVHLTGYLSDMGDEDVDTETDDEEEYEETSTNQKRKRSAENEIRKKVKIDESSESDEIEDEETTQSDDSTEPTVSPPDDSLSRKLDFRDDMSTERKLKVTNSTKKKANSTAASADSVVKKKKKKKKQHVSATELPPSIDCASDDNDSVVSKDTKLGHGPVAKKGKMLHVYYTGRLQSSGKIFDTNIGRRPLKFRLGRKKVIEGWELGMAGMKAGGKRTLVIPSNLGYGGQRMGEIPANSTLIFDVHLDAVS